MRRRQFIKGIFGVAAAWPSMLHAQQAQLPVIGFVNSSSAQTQVLVAAAYRRGLEEVGFAEGRNVLFESRWADPRERTFSGLAAGWKGRCRRQSQRRAARFERTAPATKAESPSCLPIAQVRPFGDSQRLDRGRAVR